MGTEEGLAYSTTIYFPGTSPVLLFAFYSYLWFKTTPRIPFHLVSGKNES